MSRRDLLKNQLIATGERVLGKMDSFPPVVFYLCKNGQGDICTPWAFAFNGIGSVPRPQTCYSLAAKFVENYESYISFCTSRGTDPMFECTASQGYINITLNDNYILQTMEELAGDFCPEKYRDLQPDDELPDFLEKYFVYRGVQIGVSAEIFYPEKSDVLRRLAVLIVYGDITGNTEPLKEELYRFYRAGRGTDPRLVKAAAQLFAMKLNKA